MIAKINEVNEICQSLGRYTYMYAPTIITEVQSDGKKLPKICCNAFPDRDKDFHNQLSEDQFDDAYFNIKEMW